MKELLLVEFGGERFGIWKDTLRSDVFDVPRVHGFPVGSSLVAGLAEHEERICTFNDLSAILGHRFYERKLPGRGILLTEGERPKGFVFKRELGGVQVAPEDVIELPDFVATSEIKQCVVIDGLVVPILDAMSVLERVSNGELASRKSMLFEGSLDKGQLPSPGKARIVLVGGEKYAIPSEIVDDTLRISDYDIRRLPAAPARIKGLIVADGMSFGVIDLSSILGNNLESKATAVLLGKDGGWAIAVEEMLDEVNAQRDSIQKLPSLVTGIIHHALVLGDEVIPYLDPNSFLYKDLIAGDESPELTVKSQVLETFGSEDLSVQECVIGDSHHAVPEPEIKKTIPSIPFRALPSNGITIGVASYENSILPVIDLAMCFGLRSAVGADAHMALYENGELKALLLAGRWGDKTILPKDELVPLPVALPRPYVYGCATSSGMVRLIMNTTELALHFVPGDELTYVDGARSSSIEDVELPHPKEDDSLTIATYTSSQKRKTEKETITIDVQPLKGSGNIIEAPASRDDIVSPPKHEEPAVIQSEAITKEVQAKQASQGETSSVERFAIHNDKVNTDSSASPALEKKEVAEEKESEDQVPESLISEEKQSVNIASTVDGSLGDKEVVHSAPSMSQTSSSERPSLETARKNRSAWPYALLGLLVVLAVMYLMTKITPTAPNSAEDPPKQQEVAQKEKSVQQDSVLHEESVQERELAFEQEPVQEREPAQKVESVQQQESAQKQASVHEVSVNEPQEKLPVLEEPLVQAEPIKRHLAIEVGTGEKKTVVESKEPLFVPEVLHGKQEAVHYVVERGDTLWDISKSLTGDPFLFSVIAGDNDIENPDLIFPGQKITLRISDRR